MKYLIDSFSFNKKSFGYVFFIILVYGYFLLATLPAIFVFSKISMPNNIKFSSVLGTIWSGEMKKVKVSGIHLGTVKWELNPFSLLWGTLSADISVVNREQYINTEMSISYSGKVELEETRFSIDLASLQPLIYGMPFSYGGQASGYFPISSFHKNNYIGLNGKLSLTGMEMISPQRQTFGDFSVDFRAEKKGATSGLLKDQGGKLNLTGKLLLKKNGKLKLSAKLSARETGSSLDKVLVFLGRKDARGRVQFNADFKLWR